MNAIIGKWIQEKDQPYAGLWFQFNEDGTFEAQYEPMGIVSSGTYDLSGENINMNQSVHTLGFVGEFKGLFVIEGDQMRMAVASSAAQDRPKDLTEARLYRRENK